MRVGGGVRGEQVWSDRVRVGGEIKGQPLVPFTKIVYLSICILWLKINTL